MRVRQENRLGKLKEEMKRNLNNIMETKERLKNNGKDKVINKE
jgi:hypothetical protein